MGVISVQIANETTADGGPMKNWIALPRIEGESSRQAHADLPEGTYERELGREGFFGPATQMYHSHPPTGWSDWEGPLRPRALCLDPTEVGTGALFDKPSRAFNNGFLTNVLP